MNNYVCFLLPSGHDLTRSLFYKQFILISIALKRIDQQLHLYKIFDVITLPCPTSNGGGYNYGMDEE